MTQNFTAKFGQDWRLIKKTVGTWPKKTNLYELINYSTIQDYTKCGGSCEVLLSETFRFRKKVSGSQVTTGNIWKKGKSTSFRETL